MSVQEARAPRPGSFVQVNGLTMHYREYGVGEPLLLLHGGMASAAVWEPVVALLEGQYRIIAPDSRGHGWSDNPAGSLSYRSMADDVVALIHELDLDRPSICGWSDGGQIALEIALNYPDSAAAVIANGVYFRFSDEYLETVRPFLCVDDSNSVDLERFERERDEAVAYLREHLNGDREPEYWKTYLQQIADLWLTPFAFSPEQFAAIATPTLISVGDQDQVEQAVEMYRMIPNAELAISPGCDHEFPVNRPDIFAGVVAEFLARRVP